MKKAFLLLAGVALFWACDPSSKEGPYNFNDKDLKGENVTILGSFDARKVFMLNEGQKGSNNASLDMLRFTDAQYITDVFKKMNPEEGAGLGDVGNDIKVIGNEVWITVNNSGIVEVLDARDEKQIAAITVPTPRNIAFDDKYAYVSSWAGAYADGQYDNDGIFHITDSKNPKGAVYRINLSTKKLDGSVEVGYQPEGLAVSGGKLYVANSGGISCQLPPNYSYDNTVSVIDLKKFEVEKNIEVVVNLYYVYADSHGVIFVTTMGNYNDVHSGLYAIVDERVIKVCDYVSKSAQLGDSIYCIGTETEFDWALKTHEYSLRSYKLDKVDKGAAVPTFYNVTVDGNPYGIHVLETSNAKDHYLLMTDAGDYWNPGTISMYDFSDGKKLWTVSTGVCPAHFAIG
ncbi:MAG: hypothetical protein J6W09_08905 [Bacteroidales bacterium]|nr:hypothetical protein [Bacteroidales bacterium]